METQKNFQSCADLKVESIYSKLREDGKCGLAAIFYLQKDIQENVYNYNFDDMMNSNIKLREFFNWNYQAINSEMCELLDSLGGMSKYNSAFWKPWKSKHLECMNSSWKELSDDDKFEAWYEWIDQLHFSFNLALSMGMTPEIIVDFYFSKNQENRNRQKNGY